MLFCCLWRNVEASCHKHFVVVSCHHKLRRLPATNVINLLWSVVPECIALVVPTVHSTRWSHILAGNRDFCLSHLHSTPPLGSVSRRNIAMTFGLEKLEWYGYATNFTNVTDRHTDRKTPHDGIGSACIASRGKYFRVFQQF